MNLKGTGLGVRPGSKGSTLYIPCLTEIISAAATQRRYDWLHRGIRELSGVFYMLPVVLVTELHTLEKLNKLSTQKGAFYVH